MKILLVDDDADDCLLFCEAINLIDDTIVCVIASNGAEALLALDAIIPDIIFMDINMPVLDGKECLKQIKSTEILKNIPTVICSTSSDPIEIDGILDLGAGYITKPASFDLLVNSLRQFIIPLKIQLWINSLCPECFDSTNHSQSEFV
jgi:CheY-like chemotaxis protein